MMRMKMILVVSILAIGTVYSRSPIAAPTFNHKCPTAPSESSSDVDCKTMLKAAAWSNTRLVKTGAITATDSDCGGTIALGGNDFYTLTFTATSNYADNCVFMIVNEDATRGKTIAIDGLSNFILYPGQSVMLYKQTGNWRTLGRSRWKQTVGGPLNFFTDFVSGNDSNDGLAPGAG